jgi:hypothetical protein
MSFQAHSEREDHEKLSLHRNAAKGPLSLDLQEGSCKAPAQAKSLAVVRYHLGQAVEAARPEPPLLPYPGPIVVQGSPAAYAEVVCG